MVERSENGHRIAGIKILIEISQSVFGVVKIRLTHIHMTRAQGMEGLGVSWVPR